MQIKFVSSLISCLSENKSLNHSLAAVSPVWGSPPLCFCILTIYRPYRLNELINGKSMSGLINNENNIYLSMNLFSNSVQKHHAALLNQRFTLGGSIHQQSFLLPSPSWLQLWWEWLMSLCHQVHYILKREKRKWKKIKKVLGLNRLKIELMGTLNTVLWMKWVNVVASVWSSCLVPFLLLTIWKTLFVLSCYFVCRDFKRLLVSLSHKVKMQKYETLQPWARLIRIVLPSMSWIWHIYYILSVSFDSSV